MDYRFLIIVPLSLSAAACDDGTTEPDAHVIVVPDAGPPPLQQSELFGPCVEDSQCPGTGAICRTAADGPPGGYCTVPCEDRTPCDHGGVYNHCLAAVGETQAYCERRCLNGIDCGREGYTCVGMFPPSGGLCVGVCTGDESCGAGSACNTYSGACYSGPAPGGAITGEACGSPDDCRSGQCIPEFDQGAPTGWADGYCSGNCILPSGFNTSTFYNGDALPRGTCAGDAVCLPAGSSAEGDLGVCYDQCERDSECRDGYGCLRNIQLGGGGTSSYSNGLCVPAA